MNQKLFLIFNGRFPSEKAASLFAAKSADAFVQEGYSVTLLVPNRKYLARDPYVAYGIFRTFEIVRLPSIDLFHRYIPANLAFWIGYLSFGREVNTYLKKHASQDSIIYSNELFPLWIARSFPNTFYELHDFPESKLAIFKRMAAAFRGIIVHNHWKQRELLRFLPEMRDRVLCELNAVAVDAFHLALSKKEARTKLRLPGDKKIVLYTGHLYGWKGVDTLAEAAALLPKEYLVILVGGTEKDIAIFTDRHGTAPLRIVGHRPHVEISLWQAAADVLVLPNTARERISALYTSPMKLFEYMASERPIVASDLPSVREIVSEQEVFFVLPDNAQALAVGIQKTIENDADAQTRAHSAYKAVMEHTWQKRASRIRAFIESRTHA